MTGTQWVLIGVVVIPLAFVVAGRLRVDVAALIMAVALGILQLLGLGMLGPANTPDAAQNIVSGFGQPVIIILISLFILTRNLETSGLTRLLARWLVKTGGTNLNLFILLLTGTTAVLSLFMNNLAAGALVLPIAMEAARRTHTSPAKLLIPVAYGSLLGGTATYFTTANIIVSSLLQNAHPAQAPLHFLDFLPTGGLIAVAGTIFLGLFGSRLLPDRKPSEEQNLARLTGTELEQAYALSERLWEGRIRKSSPLAGLPLKDCGIGGRFGIVVVGMRRPGRDFIVPNLAEVLEPDDILLIVGREERAKKLDELGVQVRPENHTLTALGLRLLELMPTPRSSLIGKTLKEVNFHGQYGFLAVALLRGQRSYRTDVATIPIEAGDSILIVGRRRDIPALRHTSDFIIFEEDPSDLPVNRRRTITAVLIVAAAIAVTIAGVPVYLAMLAAAVVAFLTGGLTVEEGYRAVEWQAVFLIAGMYVVSDAMVETHLANVVGNVILRVVNPLGPLGLAAGAFLLTGILTQFMGGQVTALVTGPVTISAAMQMGVSPQAIAVATAIGCSATFLTPLAHPVNIMMITPGNYKFGDFFRSGWLLTIISFIMLLIGMVLFWKL